MFEKHKSETENGESKIESMLSTSNWKTEV